MCCVPMIGMQSIVSHAPDSQSVSHAPDSQSVSPGLYLAEFQPAPLLGGSHVQTIYSTLFAAPAQVPLLRQRWELSDGDFLDVDRLASAPGGFGDVSIDLSPTLLVLHGLEGSSRSNYVLSLLAGARDRGWSAVALNFRSCSGEPNRLLRSYHSGETGDLSFAVEKLRRERPGAPLLLAGVSLGGNVVTKWLGEQGDRAPPELAAAAAISTPFDLALCAGALDAPGFWSRIYRRRFLGTLVTKAREKAARFPQEIDARALRGIRTLFDFDDRVTAPVHGFRGARDYYARCSSAQFLPRVRRPLLLVSAEDDPFVPAAALPLQAARESAHVRMEISTRGGHVGFVSGSLFSPRSWAEPRALAFLAAVLER